MLVTSELTAAASSLRSARTSALSRIDDTAHHLTSLSSTGFAGPAADAGLGRLVDLGRAFDGPADQMNTVARILEDAATAQAALDLANEVLRTAIVPPPAIAAHRAAVVSLALAARMLDQACASAISGACLLEHEADLDRLAFHPGESLNDISARNMGTAPASVRDAIEDADGLLLEAGPGGYTVMVGPRGDVGDGGAGDLIDPSSVTTMVSGVSSGTPAKLPGRDWGRQQQLLEHADSLAQDVADDEKEGNPSDVKQHVVRCEFHVPDLSRIVLYRLA